MSYGHYGPPFWGYGPPPNSLNDLKNMVEFLEEREKKAKEDPKNKRKPREKQSLTLGEVFSLLTFLSCIAGPLYVYGVVYMLHNAMELLKTMPR